MSKDRTITLKHGECFERLEYVPTIGTHIDDMKREMRAVALLTQAEVRGRHNGLRLVAKPDGWCGEEL